MIPLSLLDLAPIVEGSNATAALAHTLDLARRAEALGYRRYWLAEHHNMPGIASAATAIVINHVAQGTSTIRVGAGGIMLPNHAPLVIAEQFGTLEALHPGRIDLGLGRAPGTDQRTMQALRRSLTGGDSFPQDVMELLTYLGPPHPTQTVHAFPGANTGVPVWILGSSLYGAQLAAHLGLPYAFASHFAPQEIAAASAIYRERFQPSAQLDKPYLMLGLPVFAAETDREAARLFTSLQQAMFHLRTGRAGQLPPPVEDIQAVIGADGMAMVEQVFSLAVVGSPTTVAQGLAAFIARYRPDEIMATANIFDHDARCRSFEILAQAAKIVG